MESASKKSIDFRSFAPYLLYLAIAAFVAAAGIFIVMREWNLYLQISLAVGLVALGVYVLMDPERVRRSITGRQARYGSNALLMGIAFVGIVVVINFLAYQNPKRWDLTENQQFTLRQETLDTLEALPEPVHATAFYPQNVSTERAQELLDNYVFHSKGKFEYEFIDPVSNPTAARDANVSLSSSGTIVVSMGDRQENVAFASEQELTGALVRLMATKQSVYFLTGHGEYSPESGGDSSYTSASGVLEDKSYTVETLNLLATNEIPEDAAAIIIAGPREPLTEAEINAISEYMQNGGSLVVMFEPAILTNLGDQPDLLAQFLQNNWGIIVGQDIVLDLTSENVYQTYAYQYSTNHPITQKLAGQNLGIAFVTARSVKADSGESGKTLTELALTAPQSWAETDLASIESNQAQPNEGADIIGSIPLVVAGEDTAAGSRVVVIGDADFAVNMNYDFLGNGDLLVNSVDWVTEQENLINLTPRETTQRMLVTPSRYAMGLILLVSVVIVPGLAVVGGIAAFISRRRRG